MYIHFTFIFHFIEDSEYETLDNKIILDSVFAYHAEIAGSNPRDAEFVFYLSYLISTLILSSYNESIRTKQNLFDISLIFHQDD